MRSKISLKRPPRQFEFQRVGPLAKAPAGHKPDLTIALDSNTAPQGKFASKRTLDEKRPRTVALDSLFLVDIFRSSKFDSFTTVDGSGKKLNYADPEALKELSSVQTADFADNYLPLEPFSVMQSLQSLDLSCNNLKSFCYNDSAALSGDHLAWPKMHTLNLSYNNFTNSINELASIRHLTTLNLSYNSIGALPSNLVHFTCLTNLDLTGNMLFSESSFFSLATIQSLQTLILDNNQITHVPKFHFGFDSLQYISLADNRIEVAADFSSLCDLLDLKTVRIINNPVLLRHKEKAAAIKAFTDTNIKLITEETTKKASITVVNKVEFDPLILPFRDTRHKRALVTGTPQKGTRDGKRSGLSSGKMSTRDATPESKTREQQGGGVVRDDFFLTSYGTAEEEQAPVAIEATPLPEIEDDEEEITSIWEEVYVLPLEHRKRLNKRSRDTFLRAFKQLEFIAKNPHIRLKSKVAPSEASEDIVEEHEEPSGILPSKQSQATKKQKPAAAATLEARTEYTKTEIQQMIQSMEERLNTVERDLQVVDDSGQSALEVALDHKNFAQLQKNYETVRAQLINTLNT